MAKTRWITSAGRGKRVAAVVAAAVMAAAVPAGAAHAGASCSFGCSETDNETPLPITAFKNWCRSGDGSGDSTTTRPTCSSDGVAEQYITVSAWPGQTPAGQDWDGFQVDAGWCYHVIFESYLWGNWDQFYNQSNKGNLYVKVSNDATAYVTSQYFGHC